MQLNGTDYTTVNNLNIDVTGGGGTSGTYYLFYKLLIINKLIGAARTPIQVNVTPGLVASLPAYSRCQLRPYAVPTGRHHCRLGHGRCVHHQRHGHVRAQCHNA